MGAVRMNLELKEAIYRQVKQEPFALALKMELVERGDGHGGRD